MPASRPFSLSPASPLIRVAFTLSGACGLIFELVWTRQLATVFGVSALALATVLAIFMGGLAFGGWLGGRRAARLGNPLLIYGLLEIGIGLTTLAVTPLLARMGAGWHLPHGLLPFAGPAGTDPADLLLALLLILPPTTLMGATLPVLAEGMEGGGRRQERLVGLLYALNTLGAVLGTASGGLLLLPAWGLRQTALAASGGNLAVGLSVLLLLAHHRARSNARGVRRSPPPPADSPDSPDSAAFPPAPVPAPPLLLDRPPGSRPWWEELDLPATPPPPPTEPAPSPGTRHLVLAAVLLGSLAAMAYQVLWSRALTVVLGSSTYSFTLILVAFLLGLAGGGAAASALLPRLRRPLLALGLSRLLIAVLAAPCLLFLDRLPDLLLVYLRWADPRPVLILGFVFLLSGSIVLLPTLAMGTSFPLALAAAGGKQGMGERVGRLYLLSTLGSILGSALAGFWLLPGLGLRASITGIVLLDLLLAATLLLTSLRLARSLLPAALATTALVLALLVPVAVPGWNTARLTAGLFRISLVREGYMKDGFVEARQLLYRDGVSATISVEARGKTRLLKSNGKVEASTKADMPTQILTSLLPLLLHPEPRDALLVGLASGVTAGAALQSDLDSLTVVELEPAMVAASHFFSRVNHDPLADPRTRLILGDGRHVLARSPQRYDLILSEPSNPWIAGVSSLFTQEAFATARSRLAPGGIFCQWLQLYELSGPTVNLVLRTFAETFPHALVFSSTEQGVDLLLLGSTSPIPLELERIATRLRQPAVRAEAARAGIGSAYDLLALFVLDLGAHRALLGPGELNTDDNLLLEFRAPLDLITYDEHYKAIEEFYQRTQAVSRLLPLLTGLRPHQQAELAYARLATGNEAEALELARPLLGSQPRARRVELLAALGTEDLALLAHPEDRRLPRSVQGMQVEEQAQFWKLVGQRQPLPALDLLGTLPLGSGSDPAYSVLAAYLFLLDDMNHSAIEVLQDLAGKQGGPVASYLLGRALLGAGRNREGLRWIDHSIDAGLPLPRPRSPR
ncbi:MAG: fused MFS/spermidine synthase [Myxococcota bacterium]|jgi:spermidine synthase|nr:fused MFS/spermidine synthase [Myxococcota bacterium]